jgi:hypothetical protein
VKIGAILYIAQTLQYSHNSNNHFHHYRAWIDNFHDFKSDDYLKVLHMNIKIDFINVLWTRGNFELCLHYNLPAICAYTEYAYMFRFRILYTRYQVFPFIILIIALSSFFGPCLFGPGDSRDLFHPCQPSNLFLIFFVL